MTKLQEELANATKKALADLQAAEAKTTAELIDAATAMDSDTIYEVCTRIDKDPESADIPVTITNDDGVSKEYWSQ